MYLKMISFRLIQLVIMLVTVNCLLTASSYPEYILAELIQSLATTSHGGLLTLSTGQSNSNLHPSILCYLSPLVSSLLSSSCCSPSTIILPSSSATALPLVIQLLYEGQCQGTPGQIEDVSQLLILLGLNMSVVMVPCSSSDEAKSSQTESGSDKTGGKVERNKSQDEVKLAVSLSKLAGGKNEKNLLGNSEKRDKEKKTDMEIRSEYSRDGSSNEEKVKGVGKEDQQAKRGGKDINVDGKKSEKLKIKYKKSSQTDSGLDKTGGKVEKERFSSSHIFGVALELAVERNQSHDGVKLPVVVRECVDYIEANGLTVEGIYRSSSVKSEVGKLRTAYNTRQNVRLAEYDPDVVASLLKLFLSELPEPVLTHRLASRAEEVAKMEGFQERRLGMRSLLRELPESNLLLVQWIFVHMGHVVQNEKLNKMTLQNVYSVLSPTMQISHRVLNCIFEHHSTLFNGVVLARYITPISDLGGSSQPAVSQMKMKRNLRSADQVVQEQGQYWGEEYNFSLKTQSVLDRVVEEDGLVQSPATKVASYRVLNKQDGFPCPNCEYKATQTSNLKRHLKTKHSKQTNTKPKERPFACTKCGF